MNKHLCRIVGILAVVAASLGVVGVQSASAQGCIIDPWGVPKCN